MHTQKRIFARAIMLGRVELQSDTRVTLTVEELSRITVLWSRVKERGYRGFFELCILMQLPARFSIGVYRSHDNIFSIYLFSLE